MRKLILPILLFTFSLCSLTSSAQCGDNKHKVDPEALETKLSNGLIVFQNKERGHQLKFDALMQLDAAVFINPEYNKLGNGINFRRAQLAFEGVLNHHWRASLAVDFANGKVNMRDIYIGYNGVSNLSLKLGHFKEGFSMEELTSTTQTTFMERSMIISAFAPSFKMGLQAQWSKAWFSASGGLHFQDIQTDKENTNSSSNNIEGRNEGISVTARAVFMPLYKSKEHGLHIGGGFSYRTPKTDVDVSRYASVQVDTRSLSAINRKKFLSTPIINDVDYTTLVGFELAGYYRAFRAQGEYIRNSVHRKYDLKSESFDGFYIQAAYLLFGGTNNYDNVNGRFGRPTRGRSWGDIELAMRFEHINLNSKRFTGGSANGMSVGMNYHINNNLKLMVEYSYLSHDRYANGDGKYLIGLDTNGEPTKDPSSVDRSKRSPGERYGAISARFQVNF